MPCISTHLINKFLLRNFRILEWIIFTTLIQNEVVCCFSLIGTCLMVERMKKSPKKIISEVYAQDRMEAISKLFSIYTT